MYYNERKAETVLKTETHMAQKDTNPYRFSDSNKRYFTYDYYMKQRFGGKIAKVTLDIGCTCPNLDGSRGHGGCIYCLSGSRSAIGDTLDEQYRHGVEVASRKWTPVGFVPYFQSNTNTYGDTGDLEKYFRRAAAFDGAVMVDIATRADCLGDGVIECLVSLAEKIPVTVELGLQTTSDKTAALINRCHTYAEFLDGYTRLKNAADKLNETFGTHRPDGMPMKRLMIGVHIINGLPGENRDDMMKTAYDTASLEPDLVKIHLMHVLKGTALGDMYERGEYCPMERDAYVSVTADQIEYLPEECVLGRITGDGMPEYLLAPQWSRRKTEVANEIDKELYRRGSYQGIKFTK